MNNIFIIDNYKIEILVVKKCFYYSIYSQYTVSMIIKDKNTDVVILKIDTNEWNMYKFLMTIWEYNVLGEEQMLDQRVWFDIPNTMGDKFIIELDHIYRDYPTDEIESQFTIYQYNSISNSNILRISFIITEVQIEDLLFIIYDNLRTIPYLSEMINSLERTELSCVLDDESYGG